MTSTPSLFSDTGGPEPEYPPVSVLRADELANGRQLIRFISPYGTSTEGQITAEWIRRGRTGESS